MFVYLDVIYGTNMKSYKLYVTTANNRDVLICIVIIILSIIRILSITQKVEELSLYYRYNLIYCCKYCYNIQNNSYIAIRTKTAAIQKTNK